MNLADVKRLLDAETLCGADKLDTVVSAGCASDLMSDVLAFGFEKSVILTGLVNEQVIHTAEMVDAAAVVFVRGKFRQVSGRVIEIARERGIPVLVTRHLMFDSCGILHAAGLKGCVECDTARA
ncbi:MAG: hypothetical protein ACM3X4_13180 [Ignavibacteriales bacterium]